VTRAEPPRKQCRRCATTRGADRKGPRRGFERGVTLTARAAPWRWSASSSRARAGRRQPQRSPLRRASPRRRRVEGGENQGAARRSFRATARAAQGSSARSETPRERRISGRPRASERPAERNFERGDGPARWRVRRAPKATRSRARSQLRAARRRRVQGSPAPREVISFEGKIAPADRARLARGAGRVERSDARPPAPPRRASEPNIKGPRAARKRPRERNFERGDGPREGRVRRAPKACEAARARSFAPPSADFKGARAPRGKNRRRTKTAAGESARPPRGAGGKNSMAAQPGGPGGKLRGKPRFRQTAQNAGPRGRVSALNHAHRRGPCAALPREPKIAKRAPDWPTGWRVDLDILAHASTIVRGRLVVDLFAGTGALGIEALSRAPRAPCCRRRRRGAGALRENIEALGLGGVTRVFVATRRNSARAAGEAFTLAFLDPPYGKALAPLSLTNWCAAVARAGRARRNRGAAARRWSCRPACRARRPLLWRHASRLRERGP